LVFRVASTSSAVGSGQLVTSEHDDTSDVAQETGDDQYRDVVVVLTDRVKGLTSHATQNRSFSWLVLRKCSSRKRNVREVRNGKRAIRPRPRPSRRCCHLAAITVRQPGTKASSSSFSTHARNTCTKYLVSNNNTTCTYKYAGQYFEFQVRVYFNQSATVWIA